MRIRLILISRDNTPFLDKKINKKTIVIDSINTNQNFKILSLAYSHAAHDIDLIVTPHNFFTFKFKKRIKQHDRLKNKIDEKLRQIAEALNANSSNTLKRPQLIVGVDLICANNNKLSFNSYFNPYSGIDSLVVHFICNNNKLEPSRYIWESWYAIKQCDKIGFLKQNKKRIINIKDKSFCLLSCGDIFSYCHCCGCILPESDVYLNLAHNNYKPAFIYGNKNIEDIVNGQNKPKLYNYLKNSGKNTEFILLITQNFSDNNRKNIFYKDKYYIYIWPPNINYNLSYFDCNGKPTNSIPKNGFFFIDIDL